MRCHILQYLIWVKTVCIGLYVPILSGITVFLGFLFQVSNSINLILYPQISCYDGVLNS